MQLSYNNIIYIGYLDELIEETIKRFKDGNVATPSEVPEPLCSEYERPEKDTAIKQHRSRFGIS